jgi:hypothetical protein
MGPALELISASKWPTNSFMDWGPGVGILWGLLKLPLSHLSPEPGILAANIDVKFAMLGCPWRALEAQDSSESQLGKGGKRPIAMK